jgi:molecular chaperone DnaK
MVLMRLAEAAMKAKAELLVTESTTINLPFLTADGTGPKHLERTISRFAMIELASRMPDPLAVPRATASSAVGGGDGGEHEPVKKKKKKKRFWIF